MSKGSQSSTATIPEWQKSMYQEVFGAGRSIAQQPFIPYTGPQVAGFNPDQLRQFQATRGLFESAMGYDPRAGLTRAFSLLDIPKIIRGNSTFSKADSTGIRL